MLFNNARSSRGKCSKTYCWYCTNSGSSVCRARNNCTRRWIMMMGYYWEIWMMLCGLLLLYWITSKRYNVGVIWGTILKIRRERVSVTGVRLLIMDCLWLVWIYGLSTTIYNRPQKTNQLLIRITFVHAYRDTLIWPKN